MHQHHFSCTIVAAVPPQQATESISNVKGWWATNVLGNTSEPGSVFTVRFGKTFADIHITELVPGKKIVWRVVNCDLPLFENRTEWKDTKIIWEIASTHNETAITMTHVGLTPDTYCYSDCEKGWTFYITQSLFSLLTQNKGMPGIGIFANIIINNRKYEGLLYFKNDPLPDYPDGFICLDVKTTNGEQVTAIYSAAEYGKEHMNTTTLKGEYFMIIENKPIYGDIIPLYDIIGLLNEA